MPRWTLKCLKFVKKLADAIKSAFKIIALKSVPLFLFRSTRVQMHDVEIYDLLMRKIPTLTQEGTER